MSLAKRVIDAPLTGGVETGTEHPLKVRLETLENGVYRKRGGISKRFGTMHKGRADDVPVGDSVPIDAEGGARTLAAYGDTCVQIAGNKIYTFSDTIQPLENGTRVYRDRVSETVATYDVIASQVRSYSHPDVAYGAGFYVYVYGDDDPSGAPGSVYASIRDASGAAIVDNQSLTASTTIIASRVVYVSDVGESFFLCTFLDLSDSKVYATFLLADDLTSGLTAWSTPVDVGLTDISHIDLTATEGAGLGFLGATTSGGYWIVRVEYDVLGNALVFTPALSDDVATFPDAIGLGVNMAGSIVAAISYSAGGDTFVDWSEWDTTPAETQTANTAHTQAGVSDPIYTIVVGPIGADNQAASLIAFSHLSNLTRTLVVEVDAVTTSAATTGGQLRIVSKPWRESARAYLAVQRIGSLGGVFVAEANPGGQLRPTATLLPRVSDYVAWPTVARPVSSVVTPSPGVHVFATFAGIDGRGSIMGATVAHGSPRMAAESNGVLMISGGTPATFDGSTLAEVGFLLVPDPPTVAVGAGAGSLSAGAYQYALVREWYDSKGNVHRSAPAFSASITVPASGSVDLTWTNLNFTTKDDSAAPNESAIANVLYRTQANGTTLTRVTPTVPPATFINDPTSTAVVAFNDTASDASILGNEALYTTGAGDAATAVDNVNPPSASIVVAHKNRFWLAGTDDDTIWYSKALVTFEGPAFADELTIDTFDGGRVTALGTLDDLLVIFKRVGIWVVVGEGADDNGLNSTLTEPRRVSADAGCIEKRSLVLTPEGLMFRSERGIYLLDRSLAVRFIGEAVTDHTQPADAEITSAVLVAAQNQVRYTVLRADPAASVTLVYDYLNQAWSTSYYWDAYEDATRGAASACAVAGAYRWVTPAGQEYQEDETTFLDDGTAWVTLTVETAWLKLAGSLQGYQRVWRAGILAERKTPHAVELGVRTDYVPALQIAPFTDAIVSARSPEQLEIHPVKQRCSAIRVRFVDVPPLDPGDVDTGEGATLDAITLEYGVLQGKNRGIAAQQKG